MITVCWTSVMKIRKKARKSYHEKLLNTAFVGDRNSLSQVDTFRSWENTLLNRQRHGWRVNQYDEEWNGCRTISCNNRNDKGSRKSS